MKIKYLNYHKNVNQKILQKNDLLNHSEDKNTQTFYTNSDATVLKSILGFSENVFEKDF